MTDPLDLHFLLPLSNENAWSDLLATLMSADQATARRALGLAESAPLTIRREVSKSRGASESDRPDVVVEVDGRVVAVIEVKVLSGLGPEQLERYLAYVDQSDRAACRFLAVSPQGLRINTQHAPEWRNISWEELVEPFVGSDVPWASATAAAWLNHLGTHVPRVDGATVWNDIAGPNPLLGIRARAVYLHDRVDLPAGSTRTALEIGSGGLWATTIDATIPDSGYAVRWGLTESLPTQEAVRLTDASGLRGPEVRFRLVQQGVASSRDYDWDHLAHLWRTYLAREDWITWRQSAPRKKVQWEKDGIARLAELGAPRFLGTGFGDGQARLSGEVELGAVFDLRPTLTLTEIADVLDRVVALGARMAADDRSPSRRGGAGEMSQPR